MPDENWWFRPMVKDPKRRVYGGLFMLGVACILFAFALNGPITGAGASPIAPIFIVIGAILMVIGVVLAAIWR